MESVDDAVCPLIALIFVTDFIVALHLEVQGFSVMMQADRSTSATET